MIGLGLYWTSAPRTPLGTSEYRLGRKADKFAAICEQIIYKTWDRRRFARL
jgi:hypothetical protein